MYELLEKIRRWLESRDDRIFTDFLSGKMAEDFHLLREALASAAQLSLASKYREAAADSERQLEIEA